MKKKGFTLIELLAVILILGIIALIAIPMVMNIVEDAKKGAAKVSSENYKRAVENYLMLQEIKGYPVKLENNTTYMVSSSASMDVTLKDMLLEKVYAETSDTVFLNEIINIKGEYPYDGYVTIGTEEVEKVALAISGYITECDSDTCEVIEKDTSGKVSSVKIDIPEDTSISPGSTLQLSATILPDSASKRVKWTSSDETIATVNENGLVTALKKGAVTISVTAANKKTDSININISNYKLVDANNNGKGDIGEEIVIGTEEFYIISVGEGTQVTAFAKYNLNVGGYKVAGEPEGLQSALATGWTPGPTLDHYPGVGEFSRFNNWGGNQNINPASLPEYWGSTATIAIINYKTIIPAASDIRLITMDELNALGRTDGTWPDWAHSTSYWTETTATGDSIYYVYSSGLVNYGNASRVSHFGIRPVIVID